MNLFIGKYQAKPVSEDLTKSQVQFRANSKVVTELSDDIFKIASTAISSAGIATLGIQANKHLRKKSVEEAATVNEEQSLISRNEFGNRLGIKYHSIEWHLNEEHIVMNEDGLIDLNNRFNKRFIETFKKGKRFNESLFTPKKYEKLQMILGKNLPLDYCLNYGLLVAEEDGLIDILEEPNKTFIEKIKNNELTYKNFFMSLEQYAAYLTVHPISVQRAINRGEVVLNDKKRIDINRAENKAFETKVRYAQKRAEEKGLKRTTSFVNVPDDYKTKLTQMEFASKLGYKTPQGLIQHIKNGRIVIGNDGFIDITIEPNKSFMESKLNGTYVSQPDMQPRTKGKKEVNPNEFSRRQLAIKLGISDSTLVHHIKEGHLVLNENDKIDVTNETNKYFLENYKKGVPLYPNTQVKPPKQPVIEEPGEKNPNIITLKDLSHVTGLTLWPLIQHANRGRIIREKDGVDVTNPLNKTFINVYEENGLEKLDKMSLNELAQLRKRVENRYRSFIPRNIYVQAKEAKNKSEEDFDAFIKNTTYSLFRVEILSPNELKFMQKMVRKIIQTRINDSSKPADFSDIKDFYLTGVIELEHELNIIDKLMDTYGMSSLNEDYNEFLNTNKFNKADLKKLDIKNVFEKAKIFNIKGFEKILEWLRKGKEVNVDKLSINDLKLKLLELGENEHVKQNDELVRVIEFLFEYKLEDESEINTVRTFTKELIKYSEEENTSEFPKEVLESVKELEDNYKKSEQKKQALFERVNSRLNDCITLLYSKGLSSAAEMCYNYIPDGPDDAEQINKANYIIKLALSLNEPIVLPGEFENKTEEEKAIELERLRNKQPQEVEDKMIGYDIENSDSSILERAREFAKERYGSVEQQYIGEYVRHFNNLENCDFSSYPSFCNKLYEKLISLDTKEAITILSKLDEWNYLAKSEKKKFRSLSNIFSADNPVELEYLVEYIENDYKNYDTVITAVNINDTKTRIPATLSKKAKEQMLKQVVPNELPKYFEAFEYSMTKIVPDGNGIKEHRKKNHEVRISLPARLYSPNKDFYFDEFEYHAHQGSKT